MHEFEEFTRLLQDRYGLDPMDVGIDSFGDYLAYAGDDSPEQVVASLAKKYKLERIR